MDHQEGIAIFIPDDEPIGSEIVYVNDAFVRQSGYTADQLVGHSALLLAGARPSAHHITRAMRSRKPYIARERKVRPDGSSYEAEIRLEAISPTRIVLTQRAL